MYFKAIATCRLSATHYIDATYPPPGCVGVSADILIGSTYLAVGESRLFRCLICSGLTCVPVEWLVEGGMLYNKALEHLSLEDKETYNFPFDGITAKYDEEKDRLVPVEVRVT